MILTTGDHGCRDHGCGYHRREAMGIKTTSNGIDYGAQLICLDF